MLFTDEGMLSIIDTSPPRPQPRRKGQRLSMEDIEEIQSLYAQGHSRKEIARMVGVTYTTVYLHTR
jgi:DNA invertase Pin-like site-specific DNA recombinase